VLPTVKVLIGERSLNAEAIRQLGYEHLITWMYSKWGLKILRAEVKDPLAVLVGSAD
jgi:hypothetical protein